MTEIRYVPQGPFRGYVSSRAKHAIGLEDGGPDSRDMLYSPTEGKWVERAGSSILGDTFSTDSVTGLLPSKYSSRARQILEFPALLYDGVQLFSDTYPSYMVLMTNEDAALLKSRYGQIYFRSSNSGGSNQVFAMSFSADTYPTTARSGDVTWLKVLPMWSETFSSTDFPAHRCTTTEQRQRMFAGSRRVLISGRWLYAPNYLATPSRSNMIFNDSSSSPSRKERHWHTGIHPPLFPGFIKTADLPAAGTAVRPWKKGDKFWFSLCWIFEDGQWSMPFIPSPRYGAAVAGGQNDNYGLVTLPAVSGTDYYDYIPWRNIPKGPDGVVGRALLRSPKVDSATGAIPALNDLRVTAIIPDNITTTYNDYNGDDLALLIDDERVRFDHITPPRARYIAAFDGRVAVGYSKPNATMIYLAPTGVAAPNDITDDDDATMGNVAYLTLLTGGTSLKLRKVTAAFPAVAADFTINFTASMTVQDLIDAINATVPTDTADEWRAQLAPGADASMLVSRLADYGASDPFGDNALCTTGNANQQAFCQAWPGVIFRQTQGVSGIVDPLDKLAIWHTRSAPESAIGGVTAAPNFYVAGNRRAPPDADSGILMGMAALTNGMVVFYSRKVWLFQNIRDGRTGRDEDYRFNLLSNDGCIAWDSIVEFNDAVGWLSAKGYKVAGRTEGGFQESLISGAIFDPEDNPGKSTFRIQGNLTYEVEQCIAASAADNDAMEFRARVINSALYIHYRSSSSASKPDVMQVYDYSEGAGSGGLRELFRGDGSPYGWSPPHRLPGSCIGSFRKSTGLVKLHTIDTNAGSTGDGRVDQFDTGYQDNGTAIASLLYLKQDDMGVIDRRHRTQLVTVEYASPTGNTLTMRHSRDRARASQTDYTMENTGTAELATQTKRVKLEGQSPARVTELSFASTRVTAGPAVIRSLVRKSKILNPRPDGAG